jgi:hypothetical protein
MEENLKSQPNKFWKYVASSGKRNSNSVRFDVDAKSLIEPCGVADEFLKHLQPVYNCPCPVVFPTKSTEVDDIPGLILWTALIYLYLFL